MELRNPLPRHDPWSPVGYRVVEVADEQAPGSQPNRQPTRSGEGPKPVEPAPPPAAPLGYRVTQVAEETVPAEPRAPSPRARAAEGPRPLEGRGLLEVLDVLSPRARRVVGPQPRRPDLRGLWVTLAVGGFFVVLVLFTVVLASMQTWEPARPRPEVAFGNLPVPEVNMPAAVVVIPPEDAAGKPAAAAQVNLPNLPAANGPAPAEAKDPRKGPAFPAGDGCDPGKAPAPAGGRETFGTAVAFARNPREALHSAARERKLAFVLHVSGNFEEARFT